MKAAHAHLPVPEGAGRRIAMPRQLTIFLWSFRIAAQLASPESITLTPGLWIPDSPASARAPE